jgi:hypothetical protein
MNTDTPDTPDTPETDEALSTAECESDLVIKMRRMERERDEARAEMIRWQSIAEGRGRTDDDEENDTQAELAAWELLTEATRERDEWKAKYIQQNKDLGCELRDPNGTIWDHAKTLQRHRDEARAESIRWQSIAEGRGRTDDEESDCSVCGGCFMIPGTEPNDDVMNTPCPKCNGHSEDTAKAMSNLIRQRDEAREQRDNLAKALEKVSRSWNYVEVAQQALQSLTPKEKL